MKLSQWRKQHQKTLADVAGSVGISGANPGRSLQRYESGERVAPAIVIDAIEIATGGQVTAKDMHDVRLAWERANAAVEARP